MIRRLLPLFPFALALAVAPLPAWASTGATVKSGWWNEASVGPVTSPSATPPDQLQVSNGFTGTLAFSAVRITVPSGTAASQVTLRLAIPSGSTIGTASVSACPTTGSWKAGADQQASAAPKYSCQAGRRADGRPSAGAETWAFPLSWGEAGTVSVALVPTPGSQPFSVTYTAPTPASISVGPAPSAPGPSPSDASGAPPAAPGGQATGGGSGTGSAVGPAAPPGGGVAAPVPGTGTAATAAAPSLGALPAGTGPLPGSSPSASPGPAGGGSGTGPPRTPVEAAPTAATRGGGGSSGPTGARVMAFCLLVVTGLALFFLAAQPDRAPRLLGPLAARVRGRGGQPAGAAAAASTVSGGIGRFARERTGPPTRI